MRIRKRARLFVLVFVLVGILAIAGCKGAGAGDDDVDLGPGPDGGPPAVVLGSAIDFAILAKTAITTTGTTAITGDIGLSPGARSDLEGFSETLDVSGTFATSIYVTGSIYASDMVVPTPTEMTTAISDMEAAYTAAAGLTDPDATELGAGEIGGLVIEPGLYKWGTGLGITTDVTLWGSSTATWVFQIGNDLTLANGASVILAGGALAENITWQLGSGATLGTTSHFEGTILSMTAITLNTGATVNGQLFAQSAVTLDAATVTQP